jgi:hypothetical protein
VAVTPLQRWWGDRGTQKLARRTKRLQEEYNEALFYTTHPETFTQYLIHVAIQTTFIGAAVGILSALACGFSSFMAELGGQNIYNAVVYLFGHIVTTVSLILILRICSPAMRIWKRVRNFESYARALPAEITAQTNASSPPSARGG